MSDPTDDGAAPSAGDDAVRAAREAFFADSKAASRKDARVSNPDARQVELRGQLARTRLELATEREFRTWAQQDVGDLQSITDAGEREKVLDVIARHAAEPEYLAALRFEADPAVIRAVEERVTQPIAQGGALPSEPDAAQTTTERAPNADRPGIPMSFDVADMPAANDASARNPANDPAKPVAEPVAPADATRVARARARDRAAAERQLRQAAVVDAALASAAQRSPRDPAHENVVEHASAASLRLDPPPTTASDSPSDDSTAPTPVLEATGYDVPAGVASRYVVREGSYWRLGGADKSKAFESEPHFRDGGDRLSTKGDDRDTVADMVAVAKAKHWSAISVKGTEAFRRHAWLEATLAGVEVRGFTPGEADLVLLESVKRERESLRITAGEAPVSTESVSSKPDPVSNRLEAVVPVGDVRKTFEKKIATYPENVRRELTMRFDARMSAGASVQQKFDAGSVQPDQLRTELGKHLEKLNTALHGDGATVKPAPSPTVPSAPTEASRQKLGM